MDNTTIRSSYHDDKANKEKETIRYSPTDLTVVSQLTNQAFQKIVQLKAQSRSR